MHSSKLPTELSLEILCASGSLKDAISLASTSRQLRAIWIEHADTIYRAVAPRSIEGEKHARHLQLSISQHTKITSTDAAQIVQHADFMDSIIHQFTEKIVKRTPCKHAKTLANIPDIAFPISKQQRNPDQPQPSAIYVPATPTADMEADTQNFSHPPNAAASSAHTINSGPSSCSLSPNGRPQ
jgi:hypothetical protein